MLPPGNLSSQSRLRTVLVLQSYLNYCHFMFKLSLYVTFATTRLLTLLERNHDMYLFLQVYGCCLISKLRSTFCDPRNYNILASMFFTVFWSLLKLMSAELGDAIQSSYSLSPPASPALNLSQHQALVKWIISLHQVAKVLEPATSSVISVNSQGWFPVGLTGLISLLFKGLSRAFSSTTIWKPQLFGAQPSSWSNSHICTWLMGKLYFYLFIYLFY